ncbi:MAG: cupin domain-containing protein [Bacteroidota bacterium]
MILSNNIFKDIPQYLPEELFETIAQSENVKIERIVSDGHCSPLNFWYDQDQNEFVILLQGNAVLEFEDGSKLELNDGDYHLIPAHKKHRVAFTDTSTKTVWLAVFY